MFVIRNEIEQTMLFANKVLSEVYRNYIVPKIINIKYTKSRSYWAQINYCDKNCYELLISDVFESIPDPEVAKRRFTSTIIHEFIHTIPGCMNHRGRFQQLCYLVNCKYPQYNLQTGTALEDVGLVTPIKPPRYLVVCKHCKHEYHYQRKPGYSLDNYVCSNCKQSDFELR